MPTDDPVNPSALPTVDPTPPATQGATDPDISAHPKFQELLQQKHAADTEALRWKGRVEKLTQAVSDEEPTPEAPPAPATKDDVAAMKDEIRWELKNEPAIELADKNGKYSEYVQAGKPKAEALKLALYDEGITNNALPQAVRQQSVAPAAAGVDRTVSTSQLVDLPESYVKSLRDKGLKDPDIKEIVANARDRAAKRK